MIKEVSFEKQLMLNLPKFEAVNTLILQGNCLGTAIDYMNEVVLTTYNNN
jgi:hypothetical protein